MDKTLNDQAKKQCIRHNLESIKIIDENDLEAKRCSNFENDLQAKNAEIEKLRILNKSKDVELEKLR